METLTESAMAERIHLTCQYGAKIIAENIIELDDGTTWAWDKTRRLWVLLIR